MENILLVIYELMSLTTLYSTNGFFILVLRVFNFSFIFFVFYQNCIFYEFFLFPCQNVTLLTSPIKEKHYSKNAQRWKEAYLDMLIVFLNCLCFLGWDTVVSQNFLGFLFCLSLSLFSLLYAIFLITIDIDSSSKTYNSIEINISV